MRAVDHLSPIWLPQLKTSWLGRPIATTRNTNAFRIFAPRLRAKRLRGDARAWEFGTGPLLPTSAEIAFSWIVHASAIQGVAQSLGSGNLSSRVAYHPASTR